MLICRSGARTSPTHLGEVVRGVLATGPPRVHAPSDHNCDQRGGDEQVTRSVPFTLRVPRSALFRGANVVALEGMYNYNMSDYSAEYYMSSLLLC